MGPHRPCRSAAPGRIPPRPVPARTRSIASISAANSHFYTASADEVALLRGLESQERARTCTARLCSTKARPSCIESPVNGSCAAGTIALQRVYNNGFVQWCKAPITGSWTIPSSAP